MPFFDDDDDNDDDDGDESVHNNHLGLMTVTVNLPSKLQNHHIVDKK